MKVTRRILSFLCLCALFTVVACQSTINEVKMTGSIKSIEPSFTEARYEAPEATVVAPEAPESAVEAPVGLLPSSWPSPTIPEADWELVEEIIVSLEYSWMENSERVKVLQNYIGVEPDGIYGLTTWGAHRTHAVSLGLINLDYPKPTNSTILRDGWECPEWMDTARLAGWPEDQLRKLSYVIYRESRCDPSAFNGDDPIGGSLGLIQINRYWCTSNMYWPDGYLQVRDSGVTTCDDLYDPYVNLRSGYHIWVTEGGWSPWGL